MKHTIAVCALLIAGCATDHTADVYARERAIAVRGCNVVGGITARQAAAMTDARLTVPVVVVTDTGRGVNNTRRDGVTGIYTLTFSRRDVPLMELAHELAHVAVFEAFRESGRDGLGFMSGEPTHGDAFMAAYASFLRDMVSPECADAFVTANAAALKWSPAPVPTWVSGEFPDEEPTPKE